VRLLLKSLGKRMHEAKIGEVLETLQIHVQAAVQLQSR
jgi:hypothetical protein